MRSLAVSLALALALGAPSAAAVELGPGLLHRLVAYAPNRVLDVLDLVRLRARVGPGTSLSLRATELADFSLGSYSSVYVGLPGPRGRRLPRLPAGLESRTGAEVGLADLSTGAGFGPDYSNSEVGLGFQALLVGVDAGIDPGELLDLVGGFFLVDLGGDDL